MTHALFLGFPLKFYEAKKKGEHNDSQAREINQSPRNYVHKVECDDHL